MSQNNDQEPTWIEDNDVTITEFQTKDTLGDALAQQVDRRTLMAFLLGGGATATAHRYLTPKPLVDALEPDESNDQDNIVDRVVQENLELTQALETAQQRSEELLTTNIQANKELDASRQAFEAARVGVVESILRTPQRIINGTGITYGTSIIAIENGGKAQMMTAQSLSPFFTGATTLIMPRDTILEISVEGAGYIFNLDALRAFPGYMHYSSFNEILTALELSGFFSEWTKIEAQISNEGKMIFVPSEVIFTNRATGKNLSGCECTQLDLIKSLMRNFEVAP